MDCCLVAPVSHTVDVRIVGEFVGVTSVEEYVVGPDAMDSVVFKRPIDADASVTSITVTVNDTVFSGTIEGLAKAENRYRTARACGVGAVLVKLDADTADMYVMHLGAIPPASHVTVDMQYITQLQPDGGFALSKSVVPRYSRDAVTSKVDGVATDADSIAVAVTFDFSADANVVEIEGVSGVGGVDAGDGRVCCTFPASCAAFQVRVVRRRDPDVATMWAQTLDRDGTTALMARVVVPQFAPPDSREAPDALAPVYFLCDCSGSMAGSRMEHMKQALLFFLLGLPEGTPVELYRFGSDFSSLFSNEGPRPLSDTLFRNVIRPYVAALKADMGGTEVLPMLQHTFRRDGAKNVIFITDGEVVATDPIIALCRANSSASRLFCFGIEALPSLHLIKSMALATGGHYELVGSAAELSTKAGSLLERLSQPFGAYCAVHWGMPTLFKSYSTAPAVFGGTPLTFFAIVQNSVLATAHTTHIDMTVDNTLVTFELPSHELFRTVTDVNLHAVAALHCIRSDPRMDNQQSKQLAVQYGILVKGVTGFCAVDAAVYATSVKREECDDDDSEESIGGAGGGLWGGDAWDDDEGGGPSLYAHKHDDSEESDVGGAGGAWDDDEDEGVGCPPITYECQYLCSSSPPLPLPSPSPSPTAVMLSNVTMSGLFTFTKADACIVFGPDAMTKFDALKTASLELSDTQVWTVLAIAWIETLRADDASWTVIVRKARNAIGPQVDKYVGIATPLLST